ncbi:hypothetical protein GCM10010885_01760 [Alicyclobacillus cellulosilyticus]|uniref:Cytochrome c-type biogenesis protein CcmF n=1 Tax=Alicyclobacillus cellulosilyticus TaxID=1003997 RepID=A0A917NFF6_9BACL|nr:cytochrome c-type biogenesis CcmF C-terminal domain-containing protein [Alicyclobacillus cellulosilyticus]GGI95749.1 hypothetical protein GCM10010885_01760 [Alicyclobacillus cellulosilyticus]
MGALGAAALRGLWLVGWLSLVVHAWAAWSRGRAGKRLRRAALWAQFFLAALACASLVVLLVREDARYAYVAEYTGPGLPVLYRIAALWGGNAGSLLFWTALITLYGAVMAWAQPRDGDDRAFTWAGGVLSAVAFAFATLLVFAANPFVRLPGPTASPVSASGGLSPLLQNPGMAVHPVDVYLGLTGMTVPFAWGVAGWVLRLPEDEWFPVVRRWTLVAWSFLTIGMLYGARWSYEVLGWGGYWAWDPVENASLLPWLSATAFLHTAMAQERRGMFRRWNAVLVAVSFWLSLFATFLTRSGALWSIHAFASSRLGPWLLVVMLVFAAGAALAIARVWRSLTPRARIERVLSREGGVWLNNLLLLSALATVLCGTVLPWWSQLVAGRSLTVSAAFYNAVNAPLFVCLLLGMGLAPWLAWRQMKRDDAWAWIARAALFALVMGLATAASLHAVYRRSPWLAVAALTAAWFVIASAAADVYRSLRSAVSSRRGAARADRGRGSALALWLWLRAHRRRIGAYLVHVGVAVCAIGVAASGAYHLEVQRVMRPGAQLTVGRYDLTFTGLGVTPGQRARTLYANVLVARGGRVLGVMQPSATFYPDGTPPLTRVAIYSEPWSDLYLVLLGTGDGGSAVLDAHLNPMVAWIWFGGEVLLAGSLLCLWPKTLRVPVRSPLRRAAVAGTVVLVILAAAGGTAWGAPRANTRPSASARADMRVPRLDVVLIPAPVRGVMDVVERMQVTNRGSEPRSIRLALPGDSRRVTVNPGHWRWAGVQGGMKWIEVAPGVSPGATAAETVTYTVPYSAAGTALSLTTAYDADVIRLFLPEGGWFVSAEGLLAATQTTAMGGTAWRVYTRLSQPGGVPWVVHVATMPHPFFAPTPAGLPVLGRVAGAQVDVWQVMGNLGWITAVIALAAWGTWSSRRRSRSSAEDPGEHAGG